MYKVLLGFLALVSMWPLPACSATHPLDLPDGAVVLSDGGDSAAVSLDSGETFPVDAPMDSPLERDSGSAAEIDGGGGCPSRTCHGVPVCFQDLECACEPTRYRLVGGPNDLMACGVPIHYFEVTHASVASCMTNTLKTRVVFHGDGLNCDDNRVEFTGVNSESPEWSVGNVEAPEASDARATLACTTVEGKQVFVRFAFRFRPGAADMHCAYSGDSSGEGHELNVEVER